MAKIQVRRDTTANWNAGTPPTLDAGEIGLDTDLKQIKVGDNINNWTALPWLGGTLPYFSSPNADIDDASMRVMGLYRYAGVASITGGVLPAAPIDIKAADGGINLMVLPFGTVVLQHLWTDGDGTQPQKSYTRIYDSTQTPAWRPWTPQNLWGVDSAEGVDAKVRDIEVQRNATVKGTLSTQGSVNIGDSAGDVGVFQQGTAALPSQTFAGDPDTGAYSPAANEWGVATSGTRRVHVTDTLTKVENPFRADGVSTLAGLATLLAGATMNGQRAQAVGNATALTDALNWQTLLSNISILATASNGGFNASNGSAWTVADIGSNVSFTPAAGGTYDGLILSFAGNGTHNSAITRSFNNLSVPVTTGGASGFAILIAIKRS